ncbi:LOG family protein [Candidatus Rhodobacter oscarellae]|uniref:LOG family protein n=1 Tax=Candidatus Rhodobacter oscarellae TaxID=1675527 RepID=UPI000670844F|nr:TIGR00730 family Rossman fold protein [Candidatus Rhodobacter lobularis]
MARIATSVCVFCGARPGNSGVFVAQAQEMGAALAHEGWRLVFGAGDRGIMGAVAESHRTAGGESLGVIPTHLMGFESANAQGDTLVITENMHERKKVMFMNSDAVVVLPGGAGSLDEFFEVLTWRQLGLHQKPIVLINVEGYWDPLLALIDSVIDRGFADASLRDYFSVAASVDDAMAALRAALS